MKRISFMIICLLPICATACTGPGVPMKAVPGQEKADRDYHFVWSINLDETAADEYVIASGYSDGIDYSIYRDLEDETSLLFRFDPVLLDDSNKSKPYYWGYPWDMVNIVTRRRGGQTQILCSFDHGIERDGEIELPDWQKQIPAVFFTGKSTQPDIPVGEIGERLWLTLDQIAARVRVDHGAS